MKEDREPCLHKLAYTQRRNNHPRKSGDTFSTGKPIKVVVTHFSLEVSQTQFQPQSQQKFALGG